VKILFVDSSRVDDSVDFSSDPLRISVGQTGFSVAEPSGLADATKSGKIIATGGAAVAHLLSVLTAGCGGSQKFCFEILIHFNEEGSYLNHV
jgi:hypothetical protein